MRSRRLTPLSHRKIKSFSTAATYTHFKIFGGLLRYTLSALAGRLSNDRVIVLILEDIFEAHSSYHFATTDPVMASDEIVWQVINQNFCAYKLKCVSILSIYAFF